MKLEISTEDSQKSTEFSDDDDSQQSEMSNVTIAAFTGALTSALCFTQPTTVVSSNMYITLEGLNSGVPTRTTPTLTPTTLKNIEETFFELQTKTEPHENEAGFVPPLVLPPGPNQYMQIDDCTEMYMDSRSSPGLWNSTMSQCSSDSNTRSTPPLLDDIKPSRGRRHAGGRKPAHDANISPEEEERRKIRRERNKAAAARCRKRRVDHTNQLVKETEDLEQKKQALQREFQELADMKKELEYILETHRSDQTCCYQRRANSPPDVKPAISQQQHVGQQQLNQQQQQQMNHLNYVTSNERVKTEMLEPMAPLINIDSDVFSLPSMAKRTMLNSTTPYCKPSRPNSLNFGATAPKQINNNNNCNNEIVGVPISTPSTGMHFNFDSLMTGGTGLTPVNGPLVPNCSTQQRNLPSITMESLHSPDTCNGPPKLVSL